jgi:hypothetical protein
LAGCTKYDYEVGLATGSSKYWADPVGGFGTRVHRGDNNVFSVSIVSYVYGGKDTVPNWLKSRTMTAVYIAQDFRHMFNFTWDGSVLELAPPVGSSKWTRHFPEAADPGYLLLSAVDPQSRQFEAKLLRIADGSVMVTWKPNWPDIYRSDVLRGRPVSRNADSAIINHPLILDDGSIVFNTSEFFVRLEKCTGNKIWVSRESGHHSIEQAADGNIWGLSFSKQILDTNSYIDKNMSKDAIVKLSPDGHVFENISFADVLIKNGLAHLLFGMSGRQFEPDAMHLNQVTEAKSDGKFWQKGDLLISARHISTVFLFRPGTRKIIWYKSGPWMNQHASMFVDDHRISVFDNNVLASMLKPENAYLKPTDFNRVIVYDFETDQIQEPFANLLNAEKPRSTTEGRAQILADGGLFFEETNNSRILRFSKDGLLWSFVNDLPSGKLGALGWSRYLTKAEVPAVALEANCPASSLKP